MTDYKSNIRNFIVQNFLFGQSGNLTDAASFLQEGIIDSTGVLELAMHLETTYGIKVKDEELLPENLDSINAIASFLERKLPGAGTSS
jgi:acyl carrier protein